MLLNHSAFLRLCACAERGNVRTMKTVAAHFDRKQIVLEEPVKLTAHTKLKVIVAEEGETFSNDDLSRWFLRLSEPAFANVWDNARCRLRQTIVVARQARAPFRSRTKQPPNYDRLWSPRPEWRLDKAQQNGALLRKWPQRLAGGSRKPGSIPCKPRFPRAGWGAREGKKD